MAEPSMQSPSPAPGSVGDPPLRGTRHTRRFWQSPEWHRPAFRRVALGVLLVLALVATVLTVRGETRIASENRPAGATRVPFGTWKPMSYGSLKAPVTADARVVRLVRYDALTEAKGAVVRHDGAAFVVAEVQCRCPVSEDLLAPGMTLLDGRGRQWDRANLYGTYTQLEGMTKSFDLGKAENMLDGVTTYGEIFEVPTDATGLALFIDPYRGKLIYGE